MKHLICPTAVEAARAFITGVLDKMEQEPKGMFNMAFSGGDASMLIFYVWAHEYSRRTAWERIRIYWVEECCVPFGDSESNYGQMCRLMLDAMPFLAEYVCPINGAAFSAEEEASRYSLHVAANLPCDKVGVPVFDCILLEVGEDGHTASIFPGQEHLLASPRFYEVSTHPQSGQLYIGMTGSLLFAARKLVFFVMGGHKMGVIREMLACGDLNVASYVAHHALNVELLMDEAAAGMEEGST